MKDSPSTAGSVWRATLVPDLYGKILRIEAVGREDVAPDMQFQLREYTAQKIGSLTEWMDEEAHAGRPRHCNLDQHAMTEQPGVIILRGDLHDLEDLARYADNTVRPKEAPSPKTTQRGGHLRLVASGGIVLD